MRVLFTGLPVYGHLLPMLPLAVAARAAGDEVAVATADSMAGTVGDLDFFPAGAASAELRAEHERRSGVPGRSSLSDVAWLVELLGNTRVDLSYDAVLAVAKKFRPDLIIADFADVVAPLVAATAGVPWATHNVTTPMPPQFTQAWLDELAARAEALGLTLTPPVACLEPFPPALRADDHVVAEDEIAVRPQPYRPPGTEPRAARDDSRTRVLLTLGTEADPAVHLSHLLAGLSEADAEILVTTEPVAAAPAHIRFVGFTPLADLLEEVDAVVTAGGAGTVTGALSRGLPMVILPMVYDQSLVAERAAATGAAIVVPPQDAEGQLGNALAAVLDDPAYRAAARELAAQIAELPSPQAAWTELRRRVTG
ncbi:glycosyltransferase [Amycolatopsis sp. NBC_00345]|uniref:glycosyltransferase n=1 Tax=Amycolatopsis sp. NBC_00345 TaxID=2975955 RepID=UPI002E26B0F2